MQVTSLELSKTLYKLSGWKTTYFYVDEPGVQPDQHIRYDLGYLIRKLDSIAVIRVGENEWRASGWYGRTPKEQGAFGDTPEDALASLAIELHKQGILTKQNSLKGGS